MSLTQSQLEKALPLGRKKAGIRFAMVEIKELDKLGMFCLDNPIARAVLDILIARISNRNTILIPQKLIQAAFGFKCDKNGEIQTYTSGKQAGEPIPKISASSIQRALAILEDHNYIEKTNAGGATLININKRVVWADKRILMEKIACFDATIYAIGRENPNRKTAPLKQIKGTVAGL